MLFGGRVYGIESASNYYYSVSARDLTVAQSASFLAIVQNPENLRLDVEENIAANQARRDRDVLPAMLREGRISPAEYQEALATPVTPAISSPSTGCQTALAGAGFFCDFVLSEIRDDPSFGADPETRLANLKTGGYNIFTTLDLDLQSSAAANVPAQFPRVDLGGAIVSVEPGTGKIRAMAQNRAYSPGEDGGPGTTALNYNVDAVEGGSTGFQGGSTYKVFVLAE